MGMNRHENVAHNFLKERGIASDSELGILALAELKTYLADHTMDHWDKVGTDKTYESDYEADLALAEDWWLQQTLI